MDDNQSDDLEGVVPGMNEVPDDEDDECHPLMNAVVSFLTVAINTSIPSWLNVMDANCMILYVHRFSETYSSTVE